MGRKILAILAFNVYALFLISAFQENTGYLFDASLIREMRLSGFDVNFNEWGWGTDILREVTQRNLQTRVIIMTAYPSTEAAQESFRLHAVDYLAKPLEQFGLLNSVDKALEQRVEGSR